MSELKMLVNSVYLDIYMPLIMCHHPSGGPKMKKGIDHWAFDPETSRYSFHIGYVKCHHCESGVKVCVDTQDLDEFLKVSDYTRRIIDRERIKKKIKKWWRKITEKQKEVKEREVRLLPNGQYITR